MSVKSRTELMSFHHALCKYVNGGSITRADKLLSVLCPILPRFYNARRLVSEYHAFERLLTKTPPQDCRKVRIAPYQGANKHVQEMMGFLDGHLRQYLTGAYVHGSLGTYDEVAYSDFDALVILSASAFKSADTLRLVGRKLHEARKIMLDYDPLQHHGWFVLTDADLRAYPENYFPSALFHHAKALLPDQGTELVCCAGESAQNFRDVFNGLADVVARKALYGPRPGNLYELKCFLSEIMLLPALYVQARDNSGVYKKDSFDRSRADFTDECWKVMDQISGIRSDWHYEAGWCRRRLLGVRHVVFREWVTQTCSPRISEDVGRKLTGKFYAQVALLANTMRNKLGENPSAVMAPPSTRKGIF